MITVPAVWFCVIAILAKDGNTRNLCLILGLQHVTALLAYDHMPNSTMALDVACSFELVAGYLITKAVRGPVMWVQSVLIICLLLVNSFLAVDIAYGTDIIYSNHEVALIFITLIQMAVLSNGLVDAIVRQAGGLGWDSAKAFIFGVSRSKALENPDGIEK